MTTPTADPQNRTFRLPNAFPTLRRDEGALIWAATSTATPEELRLHLGYRLWKLWHEMHDVLEFVRFMALASDETPDLPPWLIKHGPIPPWVGAISDDAYQALDREWHGDVSDDEDEAEED